MHSRSTRGACPCRESQVEDWAKANKPLVCPSPTLKSCQSCRAVSKEVIARKRGVQFIFAGPIRSQSTKGLEIEALGLATGLQAR